MDSGKPFDLFCRNGELKEKPAYSVCIGMLLPMGIGIVLIFRLSHQQEKTSSTFVSVDPQDDHFAVYHTWLQSYGQIHASEHGRSCMCDLREDCLIGSSNQIERQTSHYLDSTTHQTDSIKKRGASEPYDPTRRRRKNRRKAPGPEFHSSSWFSLKKYIKNSPQVHPLLSLGWSSFPTVLK